MHHLKAGKEFDYDPHIILGPQGTRSTYIWYPFGPYYLRDVDVKLDLEMDSRTFIVSRRIETPLGVLTDKTRFGRPQTWDPKVRAYYSPNPYKTEYLVKGPEDLEKLRYFITKLYEAHPPSNKLPDYHEIKKLLNSLVGLDYSLKPSYQLLSHLLVGFNLFTRLPPIRGTPTIA